MSVKTDEEFKGYPTRKAPSVRWDHNPWTLRENQIARSECHTWECLRISSGWLYTRYTRVTGEIASTTFVPIR